MILILKHNVLNIPYKYISLGFLLRRRAPKGARKIKVESNECAWAHKEKKKRVEEMYTSSNDNCSTQEYWNYKSRRSIIGTEKKKQRSKNVDLL